MSAEAAVTVIIPCFNQGHFLAQCIGSLTRQTFPDWRAVIVNDASTDGVTPALCDAQRSERVTVVHLSKNQGLPGARNEAIARARTEALLNVDADDMLEPDHLATTVPRLLADPRCGIVYTDNRRFGARVGVMSGQPFDASQLYARQYIWAGSMYRRSAYDRTVGYRPELRMGNEDWDFWLSVVEAGYTGTYVPRPLFLYRCHASSWSSQQPAARARALRASRNLIRDFHRAGFERSGQLQRFERDTNLTCGRLLLVGGAREEARASLLAALMSPPYSLEPLPFFVRALLAPAALPSPPTRT